MANHPSFALFDTAIGACGIAWEDNLILGVQLPEQAPARTRARLRQRFPAAKQSAPDGTARPAIEAITALLTGEHVELSNIGLDTTQLTAFQRNVYDAARCIPQGTTLGYAELAARIGAPAAARAVGNALARNPYPLIVPCHRVLAAGGKVGGFTASGGTTTKRALLMIEGVQVQEPSRRVTTPAPRFDAVAALSHLRAADPALANVIDAVGSYRPQLKKAGSVFEAIAEAIVYQQLSTKAAATIHARLCETCSGVARGALEPQPVLRASDAKLRSAGLSRAKLLSMRDLARKVVEGELPTLQQLARLDDEDIVQQLTTVRGVGRWTAEMFLIFHLGRQDVLPMTDYGLRKGFMLAFNKRALPSSAQLERCAVLWKPYRTIASWYLWQVLNRGLTRS